MSLSPAGAVGLVAHFLSETAPYLIDVLRSDGGKGRERLVLLIKAEHAALMAARAVIDAQIAAKPDEPGHTE